MFADYSSLTEEELDKKMEDVTKKMNQASIMGNEGLLIQLRGYYDSLQFEILERLQRSQFDIIDQKTPESYLVGEYSDEEDMDDE